MAEENDNVVEPIRLLDGTLVYPDGTIEEPKTLTPEERVEVMEHRRKLAVLKTSIADLPVQGNVANVYTTMITYELIGLNHADIAFLLGTSIAHISAVVKLSDYLLMKDLIINKLYETEKSDAKAIIAQAAPFAAAKLVGTMREKGALGYMASKDVLAFNKINDKPVNDAMRTLEIVILKKDDVDKRSVDNIKIQIGE